MLPLFRLDITCLTISTILASTTFLMLMRAGAGDSLNRYFAAFTLMMGAWAFTSLLLRLSLWMGRGNPQLLAEMATLCFSLLGPLLLLFSSRYVDRTRRGNNLAAFAGLLTIAVLSVFLFRHKIVSNPRLNAN